MGAATANITSEVGPQHEKLARTALLVLPGVPFRGVLANCRQPDGPYVEQHDKKQGQYRYSTTTTT